MPSADASKGLQRPSAAVPPARSKVIVTVGDSSTFTPPASATSASPRRSACTARCVETSDDEQAVSTIMLGPRRSSRYDSRLAMMLSAAPVAVNGSSAARSDAVKAAYSGADTPTNTPVRLPRSDTGPMPACSNASQATSSTSRCCGSMTAASRGVMPKNPASNSATSRRKPPSRVVRASRSPTSGEPSSKGSQRPSGTSRTASPRPVRKRQ